MHKDFEKLILNAYEKVKEPDYQNNLKKNKVDLNIHHKATVIKIVWNCHIDQWNRTGRPEIKNTFI